MLRKKILIISRLIFPAQDPRAFRATELALELARQGHDVTLYAVLGNHDYSNYELEHRVKIRNIGKMIFATLNSDGIKRINIIDKILFRLLYRLLAFPEIEFVFRIPKVLKSEKDVDLLISVAAPYPIHWGCALSREFSKTSFPHVWAVDCGDPYMGNKGPGLKNKYFYFKYIEKWFCRMTDFIVVPFEGAKEGYYAEFRDKIKVIPQGFSFTNVEICANKTKNSIPTFAYAGFLYSGIRNPAPFLMYLSSLNRNFKFIIYTKNIELLEPFLKHIGNKIEIRDYIPREKLLFELGQMDFLVNFENNTNIHFPSKLIDYALVKRPILSIPSNYLPVDTIDEFLNGNYQNQFIVHNIEQYNIINVAKQFIRLLD